MDWNSAMEDERRMLRRILALLFFFAWLARLSCAMPRSARGYVLGVLHRAETRACGFVIGMAQDIGVAPPTFLLIPAVQGGDTVADAVRLAQNFRALAVLLDWLARHDFGRHRRCAASSANTVGGGLIPILLSAGCRLAALSHTLTGAEIWQFKSAASLAIDRIDGC